MQIGVCWLVGKVVLKGWREVEREGNSNGCDDAGNSCWICCHEVLCRWFLLCSSMSFTLIILFRSRNRDWDNWSDNQDLAFSQCPWRNPFLMWLFKKLQDFRDCSSSVCSPFFLFSLAYIRSYGCLLAFYSFLFLFWMSLGFFFCC